VTTRQLIPPLLLKPVQEQQLRKPLLVHSYFGFSSPLERMPVSLCQSVSWFVYYQREAEHHDVSQREV
jgi:hypothetical protein